MRVILVLALLTYVSGSLVVDLGDSDFVSRMEDFDLALVKFYAPWCGHCKKLAPEFDRASIPLGSLDTPVTLVKVDCTAEGKDICSKYDVKGFPTLKAFKNGEVAFDYNGPRDADGIVKYMRSKAGPTSKELKSVADAEKALASDDHAIVGFFESQDSDVFKQFKKLADSLNEDFSFSHSLTTDINNKYGYQDDVVIFNPKKLHNKFEPSEVKYQGEATLYNMKSFVTDNVHGLAGHRTTSNQGQFKRPLVVAFYDVDYVKNTKGTNYWRNRVMKVASKVKAAGSSVNFAVSNAGDFNHEMSEMGMSAAVDKPMVGAYDASEKKFVMEDEFSMDNLEKFVGELLAGNLEPYLKSEPIPVQDGPVKVLVGKNFDEIVNDPTKDVLVEFYAPWCGHCKTLAPKFDELATLLAGEEDIVIAKMDATANDVPKQFEVKGFPTLFFVPKNGKTSPRSYEGGREVDDFIKYLAKESTNPLAGYDRKGKKINVEL